MSHGLPRIQGLELEFKAIPNFSPSLKGVMSILDYSAVKLLPLININSKRFTVPTNLIILIVTSITFLIAYLPPLI